MQSLGARGRAPAVGARPRTDAVATSIMRPSTPIGTARGSTAASAVEQRTSGSPASTSTSAPGDPKQRNLGDKRTAASPNPQDMDWFYSEAAQKDWVRGV